jgi:flagellar hook-basal body complex protein FliE
MSIEAIAAVGAQLPAQVPAAVAPTALAPPDAASLMSAVDLAGQPAQNTGVFDQLVDSLAEIDANMAANGRAATELALGQSDNLHQVLINSERTRLQFDLAMSVRNRVLEAYQEIMRMQV